jgi:hypothetical protein
MIRQLPSHFQPARDGQPPDVAGPVAGAQAEIEAGS